MKIHNDLDGYELAYWVDAEGVNAAQAVRFAGEHLGASDCNAIVTDTDAGMVVRTAWKPEPEDLEHLANGGTVWLSTWGGLLPHMLEVAAPAIAVRSDRPRRVPPLAAMVRPRVSMAELAREAGVTQSYVSRVLSGERPASRRLRDAATRLTGLSEKTLFGDILQAAR